MIVTCEECTTSFQLDEARIPPGGARVRCSRCKHAFFLPSPNESAPDPVHSIAEEAAADAAAGTPEPSQDLNEDTWDGLGGDPVETGDAASSAMTDPAESRAEPASPPEVDEEEDWQFSEEVRVEGDDDLEDDFGEDFSGEAEGELDFGGSQDFSEGFDESALSMEADDASVAMPSVDEPDIASAALEDTGAGSGLDLDGPETPPPVATASADAAAAGVRDESSFGTVDDFSSLMEDDVPAANDAVGGLASEIAAELDAEDASAGLYAGGGQSDDLGDPESWDLVGSDDYGAPRARGASPASAAISAPVDEDAFFNDDVFEDTPEEIDLSAMPLATGIVGKVVRAIGWGASAAAVMAVGFLAFQAEWARVTPSLQAVSAGPITAQTLGSGWVETARAGTLLRFEGEVRNTAATPLFASDVTIALLDAKGERLPAAPILRAGLPLPETSLREAAPDVLDESVAAASTRFARTPIAPGGSLRFEAIVAADELPERAARALLEVAEPRPAPARRSAPAAPVPTATAASGPPTETGQAERSSP
ncbi:MAG: zinc-ribbon domain-containing protein [bacterium]|nr:zinc-ribbon domain-containing protein [bacterium]